MDFTASRQRLNIPVAPLVAALVGGVTALAFTVMPVGVLEDFVLDSGVASIMPAAEPPLGTTARAVMILAGGGGIALITWFTLFLVLGARAIVIQRQGQEDGDEPPLVLRRADAHPDAPARRPLFANRDLGTPFLDIRADRPVHIAADNHEEAEQADVEPAAPVIVERDIPADLDMPLAAFDPQAIPAAPADRIPERVHLSNVMRPQPNPTDVDILWSLNRDAAAHEPVGRFPPMRMSPPASPRQQMFEPGERFETFELTPPVPTPVAAPEPALAPEPVSPPVPARPRDSARVELDPSASIHALLDRLERSVARREVIAPPAPVARADSLQETLGTLRRLAAGR